MKGSNVTEGKTHSDTGDPKDARQSRHGQLEQNKMQHVERQKKDEICLQQIKLCCTYVKQQVQVWSLPCGV